MVDQFVYGGEEAEGPVASPASETETSCTARRGRSVSFVTLSSHDVGRKEWQNKKKVTSHKSRLDCVIIIIPPRCTMQLRRQQQVSPFVVCISHIPDLSSGDSNCGLQP